MSKIIGWYLITGHGNSFHPGPEPPQCALPEAWKPAYGPPESPAELGGVELTTSFIQEVPDRCDRIIWRGHYYHLPVNSASTLRADEAVVDDAMVERALDAHHTSAVYTERGKVLNKTTAMSAALTAALSPPSPGAAK